jgi:phenylpropionate dioxygenase-like ring-hydroxylating dioxygenase large terminal subunit
MASSLLKGMAMRWHSRASEPVRTLPRFLPLLLLAVVHVHTFAPPRVFTALPSALPSSNPITINDGEFSVYSSSTSTLTDVVPTNLNPPPPYTLGAWMPLGSATCLMGLTPVQIKICGIDIAVWHTPLPTKKTKDAMTSTAVKWSALIDACPHRLAPLSQGRVDPITGCIECPYHGWAFDTNGKLITLPQLDEGRTIDEAVTRGGNYGDATSLPVHAAGDLLFVFLPTSITGESFPISLLPEQQYSPYLQEKINTATTYYTRELPYSLDFLLENFMDPAHVPFAHHGLQGRRSDGSPIHMKMLANNFTHVEVAYTDKINNKTRQGVVSFQRPAFYHFRTKRDEGGDTTTTSTTITSSNDNVSEQNEQQQQNYDETEKYKPNLLIFVTPVEEGKCRIMMPNFVRLKYVPMWLSHLGSQRFLNTDTWLHDAERAARGMTTTTTTASTNSGNRINILNDVLSVGAARAGRKPLYGLNYIAATKSDLGPTVFRNWWSTYGFADAPTNTFGPATSLMTTSTTTSSSSTQLSRVEQIDPWNNHAKYCSKCRAALQKMRLLQQVVIAIGTTGTILLGNKSKRQSLLAIGLVLSCMYIHNFIRKLATAIEGNNHRSEIGDRSVSALN